jgi:hypothetical protein
MTCFGSEKPPYHALGLRQCLDEMDRWVKKAAAIAAEMEGMPHWLPCELRLDRQLCTACAGSGWSSAILGGAVPCEECGGHGVVAASEH